MVLQTGMHPAALKDSVTSASPRLPSTWFGYDELTWLLRYSCSARRVHDRWTAKS